MRKAQTQEDDSKIEGETPKPTARVPGFQKALLRRKKSHISLSCVCVCVCVCVFSPLLCGKWKERRKEGKSWLSDDKGALSTHASYCVRAYETYILSSLSSHRFVPSTLYI